MKNENKKPRTSLSEKVDNFVGIFSPSLALKRKYFRYLQSKFSSYNGASNNRLRSSWNPGFGSADDDLLPDLPGLRERSRDLNRNDGHAAGITSSIQTNVVGIGIKPQSRIDREFLGIDEQTTQNFQKSAERAWRRWIPFADASDTSDFYELQQLVIRQVLENGEIFIIPRRIKETGRPYMLALDLVEADRVETPPAKRNQKNIRSGVEIGDRGQPIAYWIRKTHPGDVLYKHPRAGAVTHVRYPVKNVLGDRNIFHLYWKLRPGQTRGVPFFAPVMTYFKDLNSYVEAELVAARISACFAAFVKKNSAYDAAINRSDNTNSSGQRIENLEPGMIEYLAPGEEISTIAPNRPGGTFDPFVERILRAISAGLNLPYEVVAKDFSRTNYSSARAALLEARRFFISMQDWLAKRLCQPVWNMLLEEAYLQDELGITGFYLNKSEWCRVRFIAPGWQWVDPVKEVKASREAIDGGLSSLADEVASQGKDWEEVLEQKAREKAKIKELESRYGVKITEQDIAEDPVDSEKETEEEPAVRR